MEPLTSKEILRYLRLEEDEDTAELLLAASIRYLGVHQTNSGLSHFWSYPKPESVAWAELDADGLGLADEVPQSVKDATAPRAEMQARKITKLERALPLARRVKPAFTVWIPLSELPACAYHPAWYAQSSFEAAVKHYGAKVTKDGSAGPGTRYFFIQLTSGRYATLENRRDFPLTVIISLEVDSRGVKKNSGGTMYVRDIEEILRPMGEKFVMPKANLYVGWSDDT
jgi:hypothetical protein